MMTATSTGNSTATKPTISVGTKSARFCRSSASSFRRSASILIVALRRDCSSLRYTSSSEGSSRSTASMPAPASTSIRTICGVVSVPSESDNHVPSARTSSHPVARSLAANVRRPLLTRMRRREVNSRCLSSPVGCRWPRGAIEGRRRDRPRARPRRGCACRAARPALRRAWRR